MKASRKGSTTPQERRHDIIKLIQAHAAPRCRHLKTNGIRCKSPALRRGEYCYFHHNLLTAPQAILVPALEDADAVQLVIQQVVRAVLSGHLDGKTAGVALYGLQLASSNLKHTRFEPFLQNGCVDPATLATLYDPSGSGAEPDDWNDDDEQEEDYDPETEEGEDDEEEDEEDDGEDDGEGDEEQEGEDDEDDEEDQGDEEQKPRPDGHAPDGDLATEARGSDADPGNGAALPQPRLAPATAPDSALDVLRRALESIAASEKEENTQDPDERPALSKRSIRKYSKLLKSLNASCRPHPTPSLENLSS